MKVFLGDKTKTFQEPLEKDSSVSIHMKNIQTLGIKTYKVANDISPEDMKELSNFSGEISCDLRRQKHFSKTVS